MSIDMNKTQSLPAVDAAAAAYSVPRVNLMPPEILAQESFSRTRFALGGAVLAVVAALAGGYVMSSVEAGRAADELAAEQATSQRLATQEAAYAEVPNVLSAIEATQAGQAQAMSTDIAWYQQLDAINAEFPEGMTFKSLSVQLVAADSVANPLSDGSAIGAITIESEGPSYVNTATWLDALSAHPGFTDPFYSQASLQVDDQTGASTVATTTTVQFTDDVLTHRFDRKAN